MALHPRYERLGYVSVCTGGGGLDLGLELAVPGARPVACVEREAFACAHLVAAMQSGAMAQAPVWSDARSFPGRRFRGCVDCVVGGIPCQPHSIAGKRLGREDERDLWSSFRRILVQTGAWCALIENVPGMVTSGGLARVRRDLHRLGFAVEAGLLSAEEVGSGHGRERVFVLAVHQSALTGGGGWPTATANDFKGSGPTLMRKDGKMRGDRLDYAAEQIWSTPRASDGEKGGPHQSFTAGGVPLPAMTARWPTPMSLSFDGSHQPGNNRSGNKMLEIAANWPTIRAAEAGQYQYDRGDRGKRRPTLTGAVAIGPSLHPFGQMPSGETSLQPILSAFRRYRATTCSVMKSELRWLIRRSIRAEKQGWRRVFTRPSFRRHLNPRFVEWLMGWPDHWTQHASTGSACSAMALFRYRQRMRSALLALPLPGEPAMTQPDLFGDAHDHAL